MTHKQKISKEEINELPLRQYTGPVRVVRDMGELMPALQALHRERVLGFDTETRPAFKSGESYPPSLLQLAGEGTVYIFQIRRLQFPNGLNRILSDRHILKVGVSVNYDVLKLQNVIRFDPAGFIELGEMAAKLGIKNAGVRSLAALLFGYRVSKHGRCSRWDTRLSDRQVAYAATDAWASREIYLKLKRLK